MHTTEQLGKVSGGVQSIRALDGIVLQVELG
jgi:hypothetical protein